MKLSELVAYRNQLNRLNTESAQAQADIDIGNIKHLVSSKDFDANNLKQQLQSKHDEIRLKFREFTDLITQARDEAQQQIDLKEQYWLTETYRLYRQATIIF